MPRKPALDPNLSQCKTLANVDDDISALRKARDAIASALKRRNIVLFVDENDLSTKASEILQAFHELTSSAKMFQKYIGERCHNDPDVSSAKNSIQKCIDYGDKLVVALNSAGEAFKNSITYVGYTKKVLSRMVRKLFSAVSSLTRAIYNRKIKVAFSLLAATALIPAYPAIAANAATLLGIGGTSGAAASIPTLLSGFVTGLVGPLCHSIRNPLFVMGTSFIIGAVIFLKHFPEVDHYIHHSIWTDDKDDDKQDMRRLATRMGWSDSMVDQVSDAITYAKGAMTNEADETPIQRAGRFTSLLLIGSAATTILLSILSFSILPMGIISVLSGVACSLVSATTSITAGLGSNMFDRPLATVLSGILGGTAGQMGAGVGLAALGITGPLFAGPVALVTLGSAISAGFLSQSITVASVNAYYDPRSGAVQVIASAVESLSALSQTILPIVTNPIFIMVCGAVGSLVMTRFTIDAEQQDEDNRVSTKVDEMFKFVTSSDIIDTPQSFIDLLGELSDAQSNMTDDVNRIIEDKYRSISRCVLRRH